MHLILIFILVIIIIVIILTPIIFINKSNNNFKNGGIARPINTKTDNTKTDPSNTLLNEIIPKTETFELCIQNGETPAKCQSRMIRQCIQNKNDISYCMDNAPVIGEEHHKLGRFQSLKGTRPQPPPPVFHDWKKL